jgi:hypothetical protein
MDCSEYSVSAWCLWQECDGRELSEATGTLSYLGFLAGTGLLAGVRVWPMDRIPGHAPSAYCQVLTDFSAPRAPSCGSLWSIWAVVLHWTW